MEKLASTGPQHHSHLHHNQLLCQSGGTMADAAAAAAAISSSSSSQTPIVGMPLAPPRTPPDQASIQTSMDKNKESLKRKLMLRRSVNELVDRGIYPPLKTPPAFAEKTKQLERAKTGDLLRHKIQQRPDRQALVQQHILEDTTIDPSLHERQRLLKRSRLLDGLNDKLAHRPGPLELVQGNILQPSNDLVNAIKDGTIQFVPTCDTEDMDQSNSAYVFDDESAGSDGAPSPQMDESSGLSDVSSPSSTTPIASTDSYPISFTFSKSISIPVTISKGQIPLVSSHSSFAPMAISKQQIAVPVSSMANISSHSNSGKPRSKKLKPKATSKARIIKFHEYKGPPSVVKNQTSNTATAPTFTNSPSEDTPYHIMLQQQQLFLQWQLEFQQKQQQQNSAVSPGITTTSSVSETSALSSNVTNVIVTSPVISASNTSPSFIQPQTVNTSTSLASIVSLQQPQVQTSSNQALLSQQPAQAQLITHISQTPPVPPPPPPLPPSRPTQSVAPRTAAKALTSIPANALSLPKLTGNLEEMKVADLKAELKKRSLPVSGPKPQLIERLKPFTESISNNLSALSGVVQKSSSPHPPSRVSTPLQFGQNTFQIKQEPNGDATAASVVRPIPSTGSPALLAPSSMVQSSTLPIHLPLTTLGLKTVASVKPMIKEIKEEPMATTDISPPNSPQSYLPVGQGPRTPMTPEYHSMSPPPLNSKVSPTLPLSQSLLKSPGGHLIINTCHTVMAPGQTVVSMSTDHTQPSSVVPAEMMPMEVDSVSVDLNQGVDDTAFKAASLGQSLDSVSFKTLIHPLGNNNYKTISLSQGSLDSNPIKINTNLLDTGSIKTVNLSPNYDGNNTIKTVSLSPHYDGNTTIKTVSLSPNPETATIKAVNLGCSSDGISSLKSLNLSPNADMTGFKTIGVNQSADSNSLLKAVKLPLSQLSPTQLSSVQLSAPLTQTLTSPASLLQLQQLQQLQTLQHLQQQLLQQTQAQQQALQQCNPLGLSTNEHVVLAQAKQIEDLQRQLQESHLKLKLQQLQQQQMQLQQQQQQMWQVRIPSSFTQNSLLTKLSQDQLTIPQQISQVLSSPVQLQQSLTSQQPVANVLHQQQQQQHQQQPTSIFLNGHSLQQAPLIMSGMQTGQQQKHQTQTSVANSSNVSTATNSLNMNSLSTVSSDNNLINIVTSSSVQPAVSLPYAIHINLTNSGQVKLPPQLQPITTSTASVATKSASMPSLQLPSQLLLSAHSQSLLNAQSIKAEPGTAHTMGPPATTNVPKSQISSSQPFVMSSVSNSIITGHSNGLITRTASLPSTPLVTEQPQKMAAIQRCTSNPFFNGPFKEPPRYDEAIKQQQTAPTLGNNLKTNKINLGSSNPITVSVNSKPLGLNHTETEVKSHTMDDVLEILIRNGDLPPSAANEPLPTPKISSPMTLPQTSVSCSSSSLMSVALSLSPTNQNILTQCHSPFPSVSSSLANSQQQHSNVPPSSVGNSSPRDQTLTSVQTSSFTDSFLNDACATSPANGEMGHVSSSLTSQSDGGELLDWGEMLPSPDLSNMDWSSDPSFNHLDLGDSNLNMDIKSVDNHCNNDQNNSGLILDHFSPSYRSDPMDSRYNFLLGMDHLSPPYRSSAEAENSMSSCHSNGLHTPSGQGSEPDLTVLGLGGDSNDNVDPSSQMDMSDWLDVIMPNASLPIHHPMPPVSSVSFTADPILTPRSQQEVFDIFNFDDSDFGTSAIGIN